MFSCKSRYSVYFRAIRELEAGCFICCRIEYGVRCGALSRTVKITMKSKVVVSYLNFG